MVMQYAKQYSTNKEKQVIQNVLSSHHEWRTKGALVYCNVRLKGHIRMWRIQAGAQQARAPSKF